MVTASLSARRHLITNRKRILSYVKRRSGLCANSANALRAIWPVWGARFPCIGSRSERAIKSQIWSIGALDRGSEDDHCEGRLHCNAAGEDARGFIPSDDESFKNEANLS